MDMSMDTGVQARMRMQMETDGMKMEAELKTEKG